MKKTSMLLLFIAVIYLPLIAQYQVSGQVLNEKNKPLGFATISIYPLSDTSNIKGVISESTGSFLLQNLSPNNYKIVLQMLGYQDWEKDILLSNNTALGKIILQEETATLKAIEVVAQRSSLESRLGKKVLRIGQDLSATGSNALEALDNIPSVSTTQKGQVQIRGNSHVIIYINGKETKRDPATLKYISAEVLEKIEVITSPSAQYDAEGVSGIINLVFKKGKTGKFKLETISNLTTTTNPFNLNPNGGINASFSKDRFSFFTNISLDYGQYEDYSGAKRINYQEELSLYDSRNILKGTGLVGAYNMGLSLEPDSTLSMGLEVNYDRWDFLNKGHQTNNFDYRNKTSEAINLTNERGELENELWINFSLEKTIKPKHVLKISLTTGGEEESNFTKSDEVTISALPETAQQFLLSSNETEQQRYYQGRIDFEVPFFNFGKLQTGVKADFIQYNILQKAILRSKTPTLPDNDFSMDMQKLGIYVLQKHQVEKVEYALGLRMEQFSSKAIQRADKSTFTQDYWRLFPSIQLNYLLPDHSHTVGFNYTRRINRPSFFDLNPFISYEDPLNLETGNPALRPEIANLYEISYHRELDKIGMDVTLYHRKTVDAIQKNIIALDKDQTLASSINLGEQINQGIEGQLEYRLNKFFKTTATFVLSQVAYFQSNHEIHFEKTIAWNTRLKQQLQLPNNWKLELTETYRAPSYQAQRKSAEQFYMDLSINKKLNNKRGSLSLGIRDIFNTREYIYSFHTTQFEVQRNYKWQTRQLIIGLRYSIFNG